MDSNAIIGAVTGVTAKWAKQRKAEERSADAAARRRQVFVPSSRATIKDAAWEIMEEAYLKASSNNTLPAHARQVMYAARPYIQSETGEKLDDKYFTQTLLPDYLKENATQTARWDVVFDARGHFTEPHTEVIVPLGTIDVREYLHGCHRGARSLKTAREFHYRTHGAHNRFGAVLFVEKEGFMPLFKRTNLAERFDIAVMSTKGLSVTASRYLVDEMCGRNKIPLLILRDFDKAGFSIAGTLQRNTRRYEFRRRITVIDFGLRLADVTANNLASEKVIYGKSNPSPNLRKNGASKEEIEFLLRGNDWRRHFGERVELNAFASGDLVAWIESKLEGAGIKKVVPGEGTLTRAFRLAYRREVFAERVQELRQEAHQAAQQAPVPERLAERVQTLLDVHPDWPWDRALAFIAAEQIQQGESAE